MTLTQSYRWTSAADSTAGGDQAESVRSTADLPALVAEYSPLLFRVVHSVVRSRAEAEDIVQDTFVRVLQQGSKIAAVLDMRVWLVRIAWNLALDRRRRKRPDQMDEVFAQALVAHDLPADQALAETRRMQTVLAEVDRLPRVEREVLLLSAMDELSTAAMAEVLGRTESATRALLYRARTRLKERLAKGEKR